jgi:hypothetical protein
MAVRTAAAQDLDAKISALLTSADTYLALAGQTGEPANAAADYFWATLISKLVTRARMKPVLLNNKRDLRAYSAALLPTNSVVARDPKA